MASQKTSCATHLEFGSMRECESFLAGTAADCTEDAEKVLTRVLPKLTACEEALAAHSCTDAAFCGPEGKVDAVGACAEVAASISAACPLDEDEFGE